MLGDLVKVLKPTPQGVYSTKFQDLISRTYGRVHPRKVVTLEQMGDVYDEFWLYASYATGWCPRMCAIAAVYGASERPVKADQQMLYDIGHAYHDMFQQKTIPHRGDDVLLGAWKHHRKTTGRLVRSNYKNVVDDGEKRDVVRGWGPRPKGFDGRNGWRYEESKIRMTDLRVVVKMDGIIRWSDDGDESFDLKTVDRDQYDRLNPLLGGVPSENHVLQGHLTMWATGVKRHRIIYVFKGVRGIGSMFLEHIVERDDAEISKLKGLAAQCVSAVKMVDDYKKEKGVDPTVLLDDDDLKKEMYENVVEQIPRLEVCPMKSKGKARNCDERDDCFPGRGKRKSLKV